MSAVTSGNPDTWTMFVNRSANEFAKKLGMEAPIINGIYRVIHEGADPVAVVTEVMTRELRPELDAQVLLAAAQRAP